MLEESNDYDDPPRLCERGSPRAPRFHTSYARGTNVGTRQSFRVVVAGAGHNSLIAAYLAKAGFRCVVLEGRPIVGGDVKTAELTLRGFLHDTCSSAHNGMQDNPLIRNNELNLGDYGLEYIFPDRSENAHLV